MPKTFFITTAIDYTNSAPHIGHAYEKILADVIARYRRLKGDNVFFLTGVDQHGQKVQQSAEREGVAPEQFVAGITEQFIALWDKLDVRYDAWAATIDPLHKKCVQGMLQRLFDEGKIYNDKQVGFYSIRQEQFLTDKDRNAAGEFGPEWGEVEEREEENYYFKLEEHKQWLLDFIDKRSREGIPFIVPDFRVAEIWNNKRDSLSRPFIDEIEQPLFVLFQFEIVVFLFALLDLAPFWTELACGIAIFVGQELFLTNTVEPDLFIIVN